MTLRINQLSVRYAQRDRPAVDAVSLSLAPGEIGVLLGPSGCGKTSLLRACAGLEPIASGTVTLSPLGVDGAPGPAMRAGRSSPVGMVFQEYALFPHLTVAANVAYGLSHQSKVERVQTVAEMLELVDLVGADAVLPHELSGGQQQRVALARALAPKPNILLLDEPFSNLDVDRRQQLAEEVRAILKRAGTTALFVTHDQREAFTIADTVGVMQGGRLVQWAPPQTIYNQPLTRFVAEFIGDSVFVPATARAHGDDWVIDSALGTFSVSAQTLPTETSHLRVRAEELVADSEGPIQGQVVKRSFRGADALCTVQLPCGQPLIASIPSDDPVRAGDPIRLRLALRHVNLF